jgi:hypothetical protein
VLPDCCIADAEPSTGLAVAKEEYQISQEFHGRPSNLGDLNRGSEEFALAGATPSGPNVDGRPTI